MPAGMPGNYTPTADELAHAQDWASQNGYGTVLTPWNDQGGGTGVFTVPTSGGGGSVRFGWGRGWFASFGGPGGGAAAAAPSAALPVVAVPPPVPTTVAFAPVQQAVAPSPVAAVVVSPSGATTPVAAELGPVQSVPAAPAAPAGGGFNVMDFVNALLKAPAMQPVEANVAAAAAPYAAPVASSLAGAWLQQNAGKLALYGGAAVAALVVLPKLLRSRNPFGRRRRH